MLARARTLDSPSSSRYPRRVTTTTVAVVAASLTAEQREAFLEHVRCGATRYEAARMLDETATRFRGLAHVDPEFRARYAEACEERDRLAEETREDYRDALRAVLAERALNPEERSSRFLLAEAATHLPEYEWMRQRGRREPEPSSEFQIPQVDPSLLSTDELAELHAVAQRFWELVEIGQGRRPSGRAIEGEATAA